MNPTGFCTQGKEATIPHLHFDDKHQAQVKPSLLTCASFSHCAKARCSFRRVFQGEMSVCMCDFEIVMLNLLLCLSIYALNVIMHKVRNFFEGKFPPPPPSPVDETLAQ